MISQIFLTFEKINFFKNQNPKIIKNYIKKILLRAKLEDFDVKLIKNIFKSISGMTKIK